MKRMDNVWTGYIPNELWKGLGKKVYIKDDLQSCTMRLWDRRKCYEWRKALYSLSFRVKMTWLVRSEVPIWLRCLSLLWYHCIIFLLKKKSENDMQSCTNYREIKLIAILWMERSNINIEQRLRKRFTL